MCKRLLKKIMLTIYRYLFIKELATEIFLNFTSVISCFIVPKLKIKKLKRI
jgi:hypothetical protein